MRTRARLFAVLLLAVAPAIGCSSLFFYPSRVMRENPGVRLVPPEDVHFRTADGLMLHGWLFRAQDARGSVLFLHGNAENISTHVNSVLWLSRAGFNVFAFDYRGYGLSEGEASLAGVHRDAEAALETLLALPGVDKDKIVVFGQSIGGAVAVNLAAATPHKTRIKAVIVDSAFSSYRRIAREKMDQIWFTWLFQHPLSWFFSDCYSPERTIARISPVPLLILHGMNDRVVPVHHGEILFRAARAPKEFWLTVPDGHIKAMLEPAVRERLTSYLVERLQTP